MTSTTHTARTTHHNTRSYNQPSDHVGALLPAALGYAARGWHVFPLRFGTKKPATPNHPADRCDGQDPFCWQKHTGWEGRATTDPDRIARAWSRTPYGIGIATGPSALVVIDLDTAKPGLSVVT